MANMSYCRFRNTLADLADCKDALEELLSGGDIEQVSDEERRARVDLVEMCFDVVELFRAEGVEDDANDLQQEIQSAIANVEDENVARLRTANGLRHVCNNTLQGSTIVTAEGSLCGCGADLPPDAARCDACAAELEREANQ